MISELVSVREFQALTVVAPILTYVIVDDLRSYRIRNEVIVALLALFGAFYIVNGDTAAFLQNLQFGLAMFALFLAMYCFGMMGGGDVKLLAVAFFWMGVNNAMLFAMLLGVLSLVYVAGARFNLLPFRVDKGRTKVPYGPTIAMAWILTWVLKAAAW